MKLLTLNNAFGILTRREINNHLSIFLWNVDIKFPHDVLIVSIPYQGVDVMSALEVTVVSMDNSCVVNRIFLMNFFDGFNYNIFEVNCYRSNAFTSI